MRHLVRYGPSLEAHGEAVETLDRDEAMNEQTG
jgi:hypothetical protein